MKLTPQQRRSFCSSFRKPRKKITVLEFKTMLNANHEIWMRCSCCGEEFDARKEGLICPKCGTKV